MKIFLLQYNRSNVREVDALKVAATIEGFVPVRVVLAPTDEQPSPSYNLIEVPSGYSDIPAEPHCDCGCEPYCNHKEQ